MYNILVTDGDNRSALSVTRSLGRKGNRVFVTAKYAKSLASSSRYCSKGVAVPDPLRNGGAYAKTICEMAKRENIDVIFPMTEQTIYLLNPMRDILPESTLLACPPQDMMQAVSDKSALFKLAESLRVRIPQTFYLKGIDDLHRVIKKIKRYPVVVKPALSRLPLENGFLAGKVRYASDQHELERLYATKPVLKHPSLIQEKIEGPGTGLFTLYDKDYHLALFSHKRLREKPPSGGVSVVSQSVPLDEEMVTVADRLLSFVGFTGVAMVEFKRDQRDGKAKLMEINGRFWGSLQLAITCGVDFPSLYLDYMLGKRPLSTIRDYKSGHKMKWFFGTLDHLVIRLKKCNTSLDLFDNGQTKWQPLFDFLNIWERNTSFDVFSFKDIGPFIFESTSYFRAIKGME